MSLLPLDLHLPSVDSNVAASLEHHRDVLVGRHSFEIGAPGQRAARLPDALPALYFPEQQLLAYEDHRESSELGQVFRIANGLHDWVDALVVIGSDIGSASAKSLLDSCCDPHHNELSRAARGSKPRYYFLSDTAENDMVVSLTERLSRGGYGDGPAENRWAMIVVNPTNPSTTQDAIVSHLLRQNECCRNGLPESRLASLVTVIQSNQGSGPISVAGANDIPHETLRLAEWADPAQRLLSPLGLLPAAFLGLDCIQLLVGAARINDNFRSAKTPDNRVLQFVAENSDRSSAKLSEANIASRRLFCFHSPHVGRFAEWLTALFEDQQGRSRLRIVRPRDLQRTVGQLIERDENPDSLPVFVNHLVIDAARTDPIKLASTRVPTTSQCPATLADLSQDSILAKLDALKSNCQARQVDLRQNIIRLPVIDTHWLGQWLQWMLLAAEVDLTWESIGD